MMVMQATVLPFILGEVSFVMYHFERSDALGVSASPKSV